jgi:glycosyltransferase involved in cell wall biosynthesis
LDAPDVRRARLRGRRLIFVNRFYRPDISSTAQMLTQLAEHLAASGFPTHVVTGRGGYEGGASFAESETLSGVSIVRVGGAVVHREHIGRRALGSVTMTRSLARAVGTLVGTGDVVVSLTDPPLLGVAVSAVARRRNATVVHWLQDVFPEIAAAVLPRVGPALGALVRPRRDRAFRRGACVAIGDRMRDHIVSRNPGVAVTVIPNWADDERILPLFTPGAARRERERPDARLVVGYQGNLGRVHDAKALLHAATTLRDRPEIRFLVTGGGVGWNALRHAVLERGLTNVEMRPYVDDHALNESLCASDIHLISLQPTVEGLVVPSKAYAAMAAGRGMVFIGDTDGEVARIIRRADAGAITPWGDGAALAGLLIALMDDPRRVEAWGRNARRYVETQLARRMAFAAWRSYLDAAFAASKRASPAG